MASIGKGPCDDSLIRAAPASTDCPERARRWVLVAAIIGSSMAFIDGTVVNVALPAIQRDLRATPFQAQWVVEAYALFLAALLLVGGALGDRFGRRLVFSCGVALFALGSAACALATGVQALIAARAVQGIGAAMLVPGSLALISAAFPEKERGRAIGTWSGFSGITAAIGPVAGGWLVDHYSWTWAFLVNLPLAASVLFITWRHVPESHGPDTASPIDALGALLATVALGGIVYAFIESPAQGWGAGPVQAALVLGLAASIGFVVVERRSRAPMLPPTLFRIANFSAANLLTLFLYAALGGSLYFMPLNLIQVQGYSATVAGAALLPFILLMFFLSGWAGQLVDRFGPRKPLVLGPAIAGAGFALLTLPGVGASYLGGFLPGVLVLGFGMTVTVAPLTTTVMNSVGPGLAGTASGVNNAVSRTASVLAIAVFGVVMAWASGAHPPDGSDAFKAAFVSGFRWIMGIGAVLALLSSFSAWRWIRGAGGPREPPGRSQGEHRSPTGRS